MHGNTIEALIDAGQEPNNTVFRRLRPQDVERPGAVLSAAPGDDYTFGHSGKTIILSFRCEHTAK
jgi:hypothetical protein